MTYWCIDDLKMGASPAARLYHTIYRELPPPPGIHTYLPTNAYILLLGLFLS